MSLTIGADKIPKVVWEYWGWTHHDLPPGLYGMEKRRAECHERLCTQYRLTKEQSLEITDHLDKCEDAFDLHRALEIISRNLTCTDN